MTFDEQMLALIDRLYRRCAAVFIGCTPDDPTLILRVYQRGLSDERSEYIARQIGRHLVDRSELEDEAFWKTPVGRQVAWHVGYPYDRCPAALVGPISGTSRQYAHRVSSRWEISRDGQGRRYVPSRQVWGLARSREQNRPAAG